MYLNFTQKPLYLFPIFLKFLRQNSQQLEPVRDRVSDAVSASAPGVILDADEFIHSRPLSDFETHSRIYYHRSYTPEALGPAAVGGPSAVRRPAFMRVTGVSTFLSEILRCVEHLYWWGRRFR